MRMCLAMLCALSACEVEDVGVPEGKLAVVGDVEIGPNELSGLQSQLGAYAQLRFSGLEGQSELLHAMIIAELLAQEAIEHGLGDDPRVQWTLYEEIAAVYLSAELERRVPRESVAADEVALMAYYEAHDDLFAIGERRQLDGVAYLSYADAEVARDLLAAGVVQLSWLGEVITTPLQERDDPEHPGFHSILFEPGLSVGDALSAPVVVGDVLVVGELVALEPPTRTPASDPVVRERLVQLVAAPRRAAAKAALMVELAGRFAPAG